MIKQGKDKERGDESVVIHHERHAPLPGDRPRDMHRRRLGDGSGGGRDGGGVVRRVSSARLKQVESRVRDDDGNSPASQDGLPREQQSSSPFPLLDSMPSVQRAPSRAKVRIRRMVEPSKDGTTLYSSSAAAADGTETDAAAVSAQLRRSMRLTPSSVVVLTTCESVSDEAGAPGLTLSTFTTLSLDPIPLVTFNVHLPSSTFTAISSPRRTGSPRFQVHLPTATAAGVALATRFSVGAERRLSLHANLSSGREQDGSREEGLDDRRGVRTTLECSIPGRRHIIRIPGCDAVTVIARVHSVVDHSVSPASTFAPPSAWSSPTQTRGEEEAVAEKATAEETTMERAEGKGGLLYFNREYHRVGSSIAALGRVETAK